jgi:hypothetical protein
MDPVVLKARFGDRLCFEGGVSVQTTLPFGDPDAVRTEEVREEVEHLIRTLGKNGGYIVGPSHAIQAGRLRRTWWRCTMRQRAFIRSDQAKEATGTCSIRSGDLTLAAISSTRRSKDE